MSGASGTALLSVTIGPNTALDAERLVKALQQLQGEDPTLHVQVDGNGGQTIIACMSDLHLEHIVDRLKREFNVDATVSRPRVWYKETITCQADGEMTYATQTGGRGQYGHAKIHVYPGESGSGYVFKNAIVDGSIPTKFIKPIDEGIREALTHGVLAGYPTDDVRVELYGGSCHEVDSSDIAFKIAGSMAFHDAVKKAKPVLLEPVMRVEVTVPGEDVGDVIRSLSVRRGRMQSQQDEDGVHVIRARVPLSEMFGYASALWLLSEGRGAYTMHLMQYQPREDVGGDDRGTSFVGAPRRPAPKVRDCGVSLPEPDDD